MLIMLILTVTPSNKLLCTEVEANQLIPAFPGTILTLNHRKSSALEPSYSTGKLEQLVIPTGSFLSLVHGRRHDSCKTFSCAKLEKLVICLRIIPYW